MPAGRVCGAAHTMQDQYAVAAVCVEHPVGLVYDRHRTDHLAVDQLVTSKGRSPGFDNAVVGEGGHRKKEHDNEKEYTHDRLLIWRDAVA